MLRNIAAKRSSCRPHPMRRVAVSAAIAAAAIVGLSLPSLAAQPFKHNAWDLDAPVVLPWKTIAPDTAYHGQWLVAGDLNGDGRAEIVSARQEKQRVTAIVATQIDGSVLWRWGQADSGVPQLGYDVPVQIYDLDHQGGPEVYLSIERFLVVLDGRTGKELRRLPLPDGLTVADCITFANLRGGPRARDIIIKDRYSQLWAYGDDWRLLWHWRPPRYKTCHHPTLIDVDADGRDEVMAGYTLLDDNGRELWTMTSDTVDLARGHADCCEIFATGRKPADFRLLISCCGADYMALLDGSGKTLWDLRGRHYESVDVGRLSRTASAPQIAVDIAHQPYQKGSIQVIDANGGLLGEYVCGDSRHHRLIDWDGDGVEELLVGQEQRLLDATGRCVARFGPIDAFRRPTPVPPDEDHEPFALVGDLDGDERPEIILYSKKSILIYRSEKAAKVPALKLGTGANVTLY